MKIGLFFGTFNPVHKGHILIAEYMANETGLDEVWLVVSPQSPFKKNRELLKDTVRLKFVKMAIRGHQKLKASKVEFILPRPSFTINTLNFLTANNPGKKFAIIIGEDNLKSFFLWKDYKKILSGFELFVYPRSIAANEKANVKLPISKSRFKKFDFPLLDISSTQIRNLIKKGEKFSQFLPGLVAREIIKKKYYGIRKKV